MAASRILERIAEDAGRCCAPLFVIAIGPDGQPVRSYRNGTITFIDYEGTTYGVTCEHVVKVPLKVPEENPGPVRCVLGTTVKGECVVLDGFVNPPGDIAFLERNPDIAIVEMSNSLVAEIGKTPILLTQQDSPVLAKIGQALAIGYPEAEEVTEVKRRHWPPDIRPVVAVAGNVSVAGSRFRLFGQLGGAPKVRNLSGMSGGPVFWIAGGRYGLMGITYGALPPELPRQEVEGSLGGQPRIGVTCELVTARRFACWIGYLKELHTRGKERAFPASLPHTKR
jgi:hypothetical protein